RRRWQAIGDVRVELERLISDPSSLVGVAQTAYARPPLWKRTIPVIVTAIVVAAAASTAAWRLKPYPAVQVTRFTIFLPEGQTLTEAAAGWHLLAMSPDGTKLAYVANSQLFVRDLSEADARPISGSYGRVTNPFFSPDAQWIGFWTAGDN